MPAKAKKKRPAEPVVLSPLPTGLLCFLSKVEVCRALGGISTRNLTRMVAAGAFPPAEIHLGPFPRWSTRLFNEWAEARIAAGDAGPTTT